MTLDYCIIPATPLTPNLSVRRAREWLLDSPAFPLVVEGQPFIMPADYHPPSALAWRHVGEREWVRLAVPEPSDA